MLGILTTHPIQYQAPVWQLLAKRGRVPFRVFYMSAQGAKPRYDPGFGQSVAWDLDLLKGYDHEFLDVVESPRQSSFWWLRLPPAAARRVAGDGVGVLWVQGWQVLAYWQAVWSAARHGVPVWLRAETNDRSTSGGWKSRLKKPLMQRLFRRIDRFLTIGSANRRFYTAQGVPASRLFSAPYCIDNARFVRQSEAQRPRRAELRAGWGIDPDAKVILFVGKLIPKKRPVDVLQAAQRLQSRRPEEKLHVLFVGAGELGDALRRACQPVFDADAGPAAASPAAEEGRVRASFAGFLNQSEIAGAYAAADCLVLPSDAGETWGLVANEAMASGLPVVVSDASGCSDDLVRPTWPDLCFPVGDVDRLSRSIEACLDQPPSTAELRQVIDRYDIIRTVEAVEDLYLAHTAAVAAAARTSA